MYLNRQSSDRLFLSGSLMGLFSGTEPVSVSVAVPSAGQVDMTVNIEDEAETLDGLLAQIGFGAYHWVCI
jgi:hypothetical protein